LRRPIRSVVADDHPPIVEAVAQFLQGEDDVELVGRAYDGEHAFALIEEKQPDLALLDIRMPGIGGIEIARRLAAHGSAARVIVYTGYAERSLLLEALDAGARGFLLKEAPLLDVIRAIKIVSAGETYIDPALASSIAGGAQTSEAQPALTKREREILRLLAEGMRNDQIALRLSISPLTVRTHVKNAMEKLGADTRAQAVARALRDSLIA
jgi:DNA-binding NarL/FixJ family response regulator